MSGSSANSFKVLPGACARTLTLWRTTTIRRAPFQLEAWYSIASSETRFISQAWAIGKQASGCARCGLPSKDWVTSASWGIVKLCQALPKSFIGAACAQAMEHSVLSYSHDKTTACWRQQTVATSLFIPPWTLPALAHEAIGARGYAHTSGASTSSSQTDRRGKAMAASQSRNQRNALPHVQT